jgi:hypothetical protein
MRNTLNIFFINLTFFFNKLKDILRIINISNKIYRNKPSIFKDLTIKLEHTYIPDNMDARGGNIRFLKPNTMFIIHSVEGK